MRSTIWRVICAKTGRTHRHVYWSVYEGTINVLLFLQGMHFNMRFGLLDFTVSDLDADEKPDVVVVESDNTTGKIRICPIPQQLQQYRFFILPR